MTTQQREQQVHPQRSACGSRPNWIDTGEVLTPEQLEKVWAAYLVNRADVRLRNRLVEHYMPWIQELATSIARKMHLRDEDNAVGEVLAALVVSIVPGYDGTSGFERWARVCVRRELLWQKREERVARSIFAELPPGPGGRSVLELVAERAQADDDVDFLGPTAGLTGRQATVLWLRFCRGMTIPAVAESLNMSDSGVRVMTYDALISIKKIIFGANENRSRAY